MTLTSIRDRLGLSSRVHPSDSRERGNIRQHKLRRKRRRSILEHLEDRRVLATYMVTSLADSGVGSLREALQSANATGATDAIVFDEALAGTINLGIANGALQITSPVSIQGPGSGSMTVDANATSSDKFRVFEISDAANDVSITGLTLTGGMVDDGGGGILFRSADTLTLVDTVVTGNQASNGGGIYSEYEGSVVLQSSSVSGNTAESAKGGGIHAVDGDVTLTDSTISGNYSYSDGAGIFSQYAGNISITDSQVVNNKVTEAGYHGGGIYGANGDITITGSTISGNESKGDGGGVYSYKGSLTISNTTITGNSADYGGGGVFNYEGDLTITSSVFTNNNADYGSGGGIGNTAGRLTISGTRITDNQAVGDGGGVATNNGLVDISESLIASNTATIDGGGIASATGVVLVTNSTMSGNTSTGRGGGIQADAAPVRLVHVTLAFNSTGGAGGGIGVVDDSTGESLLIYNSIIASNTATTGPDIHIPNDPGTALDIQSSLISNNTDSTLTASAGDSNGNVIGSAASPVNPNLSALANNGGATNTHDLSDISPATDAANLALSLYFGADGNVGGGDDIALTTDQRSGLYSRNAVGLAAGPDMGALEKQQRPSLVVDTAADVVNGDLSPGDRSFREMLALANGDLGDDEISFSLTLPATISLDSALGSLVIGETLSVAGPGVDQLTIENGSGQPFRIFDIQGTTAQATFRGLTLSGGDAGIENGGAIRSEAAQLQLFEVELLGNSAASGGGVAVTSGSLSVVSSTIAGNDASVLGGGVAVTTGSLSVVSSTIAGNSASVNGGGVAVTAGSLLVVSSTIAGNNASVNGGGVAAFGAASSLEVLNSTVSGNTATGDGGGVYSQNAPVALSNSTVAFNTAGTGGGLGFLADDNGESLSLENSIVAANTATSAADFLAPLDVANDLEVVFSLVGDSDGTSLAASSFTGDQPSADANGNLVGGGAGPLVDPGLESLADQGGVTQTHALLASSFAVDAGDRTLLPQDVYDVDSDNNVVEFLPVDQRGGPAERVVNNFLDMGSFELPPTAVIDWATPAPIVYGDFLTGTQLNASANDGGQPSPGAVFGNFVYSPGLGAQLQAGEGQVLSTTFTPNELRAFRVTEATVAIDVEKADPIIDWSNPADIVYLTPLSSTELSAVEQNELPGSFLYDPAVGSVLSAGEDQSLSVTFTPADTDNYNNAVAGVLIDVLKATPTISWSNPADIPYGTTLSGTQLNATADGDLPGTFGYTPAVGALLDVGEDQTLNVLFTPTDDANYNTAAASVEIDVVKADPALSWAEPSDIVYGTSLSGTQLNATVSGGVSGDFVYTPGAGAILAAGAGQVLSVEFNPTGADAARYNQALKNTNITVLKADPSITWGDPAAIPHGTLLSGTQLNATADVAGAFSYSPGVGAQLNVGNGQTLSVTFTPDDDNYNTVGDSVAIDVLPNQAPSFTAADPPAISEDAGAQTVTGFISSFNAGTGESSLQAVLAYQVSSIAYPGMFVSLPSVTNAGVLSYEIAANVFGEATFELAVQDNGGTDGGGVDISTVQTFTITVAGVNDAPSFSIGSPVEVLEDSGAQAVPGFASGFAPGQYEDGTWPGSQQLHDEGADGTADPLSTDNLNPTPLGSTQPGSNLVSGYVEDALSVGDMDVFTFTIEPGFQWSGLYVDAYAYPNGANGDAGAFLAIDTGSSFPYNAFDFQDPNIDYNAFIGSTVFGTTDLGGSNILPRAGNLVGSGFSGPLGAGVYTIYIQQTGPASSYTLDLEVTSVASQSLSSYEVSSVSLPSLFSAGPAIDANGDLTFTPSADTFGTSTFQVRVLDDGGTANGGVDASGFLTGTITVTGVNDAPSFSIGSPVEVLEDSGAQTVPGFASGFAPGQYEDGTWPGSQQLHDEGADGTTDPLSTDNLNPTPLGSTQPGSNLVSGYVEYAFSSGDMDVFTFTIEPGFQWSGLYVDAYAYPNGANGDAGAFLAIDTGSSFPYNAFDFQDPNIDYNAFIGSTVFGTSDVGGSNILPRAGNLVGSGFSGPLGAGTYTIYIQQTGPASSYTLDLEVTSVVSQSLSSYEVSGVSLPSLFSAVPAIDANGVLTFTPAVDTFGTSTFQVRVLDDGGTANGGVDASGFLTGTITVEEVVVDRDYGDAPVSYAVLAADNGASHIVGSLTLGVAIDAEPDGQPSANAEGDGSDDDGVSELASVIAVSDAATNSSFLVTASEAGRVDAWIDFNENGVWSDVGEQIANNVFVGGGVNTFSYVVPAGTAAGDKVVRFRLSSAGGLAPTGDAVDGEVEDMLLGISDGAVPSAVTVDMNSATTSVEINTGVLTISDGSSDLFSAPLASIDTLTVNGRASNDEVTLLFEEGPINGISLDGDGGENSLVVSSASVDFTSSGSLLAVNFQSINASPAIATQIVLDAPSISAMSPSTKMVRVTGGEGDDVVLEDSGNWLMASPLIASGQFYRVAVNQVTSEQLQFDDPSSAWENFLVPTDVDAGGTTTLFDVLLIITEVGTNKYSDSVTSVLNDPLTVESWPGRYFDVSRDNRITVLDALQVLNFLALIGSGEGEAALSSGEMLGAVEGLADDQRIAWPTLAPNRPAPNRPALGLMSGQRIDPLQQSEVQIQLQLENANESSAEFVAQQSLANTNRDLLSSESQIWADRVDQWLSGDLGVSEQR